MSRNGIVPKRAIAAGAGAMHFLITAGGTREHIDPVRFISNASSGRMGFALARAAVKAGHKVTLVTAPTSQREPKGAEIVRVETAREMFEAVRDNFANCDCLIMAAAVADYTPAKPAKAKIKKAATELVISLKPTLDILKWAGTHKKKGQLVVGFALETARLRQNAERKLREKNLDMIVANSSAAIGAERSTIHIKTRLGPWTEFPPAKKAVIARRVIRQTEVLLRRRR
ncbi:MAG: phosphopantothenoylcysteine decarboxylase [Phycisphaerales bacterium]|nr:MAG: phosphopantothenoylcysteine decarboxylase [Phycisphaerales bacterium]